MSIKTLSTAYIIDMYKLHTSMKTALIIDYPAIYAITYKIGVLEETRYLDINSISIHSVMMSCGDTINLFKICYEELGELYSYTLFENSIMEIKALPKLPMIY